MFDLTNVDEFSKSIDKWLIDVQSELTEVYRGVTVDAFFELLNRTPQWTGSAVANWNFGVGSIDNSVTYEFTGDFEEAKQIAMSPKHVGRELITEREQSDKKAGDPEAIGWAISRNSGKQMAVKLDTPVFLSNSAESITGKSYIMMLENNPNGFLRQDNEPGQMVANTLIYLNKKGDITFQEAEELKTLGKLL